MKEGKSMITKITGAALVMDEIVRDSDLYLKEMCIRDSHYSGL